MDMQSHDFSSLNFADLADLLRHRVELGIVHHVPGRIRLRLGPALLEWAQARGVNPKQAAVWLSTFPGVKGMRINAAAASLIIEYDARRLDPAGWETLVLGDEDAAMNLILGLIGDGR